MLFQEAIPNTSGYMIAGYVIAFLIMGLYVFSIYWRTRNLQQDLDTLQELEEPSTPEVARPTAPDRPKTVTKQV